MEGLVNDTTYFYGQGMVCDSYDAAMNDALDRLYSNVACNINSSVILSPESADNQLLKVVSTFDNEINEAIRPFTIIEDDDKEEYQYFLYMKRSDFREMCNNRSDDIKRYISKGLKMEDEGCLEDALKSYYWALVLCYAHPQGRKIQFLVDDQNVDYEWIIDRIDGQDGILRSFNFLVPKTNAVETDGEISVLQLFVTTKDRKSVV